MEARRRGVVAAVVPPAVGVPKSSMPSGDTRGFFVLVRRVVLFAVVVVVLLASRFRGRAATGVADAFGA